MIGLGLAAAPHVRALTDLSDRVTFACGYSPTAARRAAFAVQYGLPVADDLHAILADPTIDALLILTPPNTHLGLVEQAARAGKHVLLEKPLEITTARAQRLVDIAQQAGITLGVVLQNRFRPASLALAKLVQEGRLGSLISATARLSNWRPQSYYDEPGRGTLARDGGGVLITQAIHTLDLLISLIGLPEQVTALATTSPLHRMETEDAVAALLRYPNGAMASFTATTCAYPGFADLIELIGTNGTVRLNGTVLGGQLQGEPAIEIGDAADGGGSGASPMAFSHFAHRALIAGFLDSLRDGRPPAVSGSDALKAHRLIDAMLLSARTGTTVTLG